jgi:hypothetical protein
LFPSAFSLFQYLHNIQLFASSIGTIEHVSRNKETSRRFAGYQFAFLRNRSE